jgi:DNA-binding CsgD family transcriptional regulator
MTGLASMGESGNARDSIEALQEGRRLGERMGTVWDLPLYHTMLALPMLYLGEWDDAIAEAESGLTLADELGSGVGRVTAHAVLATIAVHRDELSEAQTHMREGDAVIAAAGPQWGIFWLNLARAGLIEATGNTDGGLQVLIDSWGEATRSGSLEGSLPLGPRVVRAALRADNRGLPASVADAVRTGAARSRVSYADAAALVCAGLVHGDPGQILRAVELYRADERVPEQAEAQEDAGTLLAERGSVGDAASCFGDPVISFERCGASRDTGRVLARMRAFGLRRGSRKPQVRSSSGWESLTKTEREVVRLAAQGLTNAGIGDRLFISPRTVQTHMAHVFAKLAISSRVQLAAAHRAPGLHA